ncbi:hypothetical protein BI147_22275 [Achromobacter xylosoxidans]|uniref:Receptor protein-tyrosine kinase n=1 Tax=Alcaligenes xylosoxydans xylosoxydans TaxID=85698 RepID=A0A9X3L0H3_ALCXX|nr:hypothetical protein [Achromobacter xylosoxidans]MCZ8403416.1 hypothetical protein [Achromobacter xylosoxidans]OMG88052.1 hypothetical protein BI147_22275 [Achromobacter xylosoxidans]
MHQNAPTSKVFYRPIEASIRWAGLLRYERMILASMSGSKGSPQTLDCPRLNELRLYTDRIYDGIRNRELPFGKGGITMNDFALLEHPDLTVRHVDLKRWMRQHYPEQRPGFLFSRIERIAHPFISLETGQAMLVERLALKSTVDQYKRQLHELQEKHDALLQQSSVIPACAQCPASDRAEATYLNIIGGMLDLMLGQSPSGTPYSSFKTQEAVVSALIAHHSGAMGIAERTLNGKFATARRRLHSGTG